MEEIFHANGRLAAVGHLDLMGKRSGMWRFLFPDASEQGHAHFIEGLRHGEFVELHLGGELKERSTFRDGNRHGAAQLFYRSGQLLFDGALLPISLGTTPDLEAAVEGAEIGLGDGVCSLHFPNGIRRCLLTWTNGALRDGRHTFRLEDGDIDPLLTGRWRDSRRITWIGRPVRGVPSITYYDFAHFRALDVPGRRPPSRQSLMQLAMPLGQPSPFGLSVPPIEITPPAVENGMRDFF